MASAISPRVSAALYMASAISARSDAVSYIISTASARAAAPVSSRSSGMVGAGASRSSTTTSVSTAVSSGARSSAELRVEAASAAFRASRAFDFFHLRRSTRDLVREGGSEPRLKYPVARPEVPLSRRGWPLSHHIRPRTENRCRDAPVSRPQSPGRERLPWLCRRRLTRAIRSWMPCFWRASPRGPPSEHPLLDLHADERRG